MTSSFFQPFHVKTAAVVALKGIQIYLFSCVVWRKVIFLEFLFDFIFAVDEMKILLQLQPFKTSLQL